MIFSFFSIFVTFLAAIAAFLVVIGIHEYGHFFMARRFGVVVERVNLGFGKPWWSKKANNGIEYGLSPFILGGYVQFSDSSLKSQSAWKHFFILSAGPAANFFLAIILFTFVLWAGFPMVKPVVGEIVPESIAQKSGIQSGDLLLKINNKPVSDWMFVNIYLIESFGEKGNLMLTVKHVNNDNTIDQNAGNDKRAEIYAQQPININIPLNSWKLDPLKPDLLSSLGIKLSNDPKWQNIKQENLPHAILSSLSYTFNYAKLNGIVVYKIVRGIISIRSLAGPLALWTESMKSWQRGFVFYCFFVAFCSVSIGFFNLLPIPGLDGFYAVILFIEEITGQMISTAWQTLMIQLGWIVLSLLLVQVVLNDLARTFG